MKDKRKPLSEDSWCSACKWFNKKTNGCLAFEGDIPDQFRITDKKHTEIIDGQICDLCFELKASH